MGRSATLLLINVEWIRSVLRFSPDNIKSLIDVSLVLLLIYIMLLVIGERRTLWMLRGFILLMLATVFSDWLGLKVLHFVLRNLVIGAAVAMSVILQSEFRRFLEQLGRGEILKLLKPTSRSQPRSVTFTDEIVDAVKELSQKRTGALMILETEGYIDEQDFSVPGVELDAEVSKELIQTIFQTSTLLHDGAMLIRQARIVAAGVILPLSERSASRQLGTRHRAAMGITERVENCICIVVSEETGSISVAENGVLNRPLTSTKLKEILAEKFIDRSDREVRPTSFRKLLREMGVEFSRLLALPLSKKPPR
ncbi:MAG: hypothetical protein RLZZ511_3495 [Cyanobacteriota bacterium]|jgi:uncharacterized protein (TIGR00159 family)